MTTRPRYSNTSLNRSHIEDALLYFITNYDQETVLTRTKLVKLLYLADRQHFSEHDRSITGVRYLKYHYGPYSDEITGSLERLEENDRIHIHTQMTDSGRQYHHEPCCRYCQHENDTSLTDTHIETLNAIHSKHAPLDTTAIVESICESEPVNSVKKYGSIPLN